MMKYTSGEVRAIHFKEGIGFWGDRYKVKMVVHCSEDEGKWFLLLNLKCNALITGCS